MQCHVPTLPVVGEDAEVGSVVNVEPGLGDGEAGTGVILQTGGQIVLGVRLVALTNIMQARR